MRRGGGPQRPISGTIVALLVLAGLGLAPTSAEGAGGYRVDSIQPLASGVEYRRLVRSEGPVVAHVIRAAQNISLPLSAVLSNDQVAGGPPVTELTSSMCRRARCIAAINGDFYHSTGEPVGAMLHAGEVLRSPEHGHNQLTASATGVLSAGPMTWAGRLVSSELGSLDLHTVNRQPGDGVTLYTPEYGPSTPVISGARIVLSVTELPRPLGTGQTGLVQLVSFSEGTGATAIPPGGSVLVGQGSGAETLRALWVRSRQSLLGQLAVFRLESTPSGVESIGGNPILLKGGQVILESDDQSDLVRGSHPRTLVGWNAGETFLVVVDGRQPGYSVGLNLWEAAELLASLGATEGLNLDGGGSATLAIDGKVVNRPSDRLVLRDGRHLVVSQPQPGDTVIGHVERPVANALTVVAASPVTLLQNIVGTQLVAPPPGTASPASQDDPASRPPSGS